MVKIETPDHGTFEAATQWSEITLRQFEDLANLEIPELLRDLWVLSSKGSDQEYNKALEKIDSNRHIGENAEYFRKVMEILTTMPKKILEITEWNLVTDFYYEYLHQFVISTFYLVPLIRDEKKMEQYKPDKITEFQYRDKTYYLPKSLRIFGDEVVMAQEDALAVTEAADIEIAFRDLEEKGVQKFAVICGIYCREKDQPYDQTEALQRAEAFRNLDMSIVWSVFFCISERFSEYMNDTRRFLKNPNEAIKVRRSRVATWRISTTED